MDEEFEPDQLVEFCQRLGLGNKQDGYLDEKELAIVCNYIGLQAPEEMLKELFETLDTDKDGRVCLDELSQMLRGMPKNPPSPEKHKKLHEPTSGSSSTSRPSDFSNVSIVNGDRASFSILDPNSSGFTKSGVVLDMWSEWGIGPEQGVSILKDLGFPVSSKNNSINVHDLTKALEEETDNAKETLSPIIQTALLTYKTETQYLRSICESMEGERDKLRSDIAETHQRSSLLAQEVDEQNARLEKNSQLLLHKMEIKYTEQLHELQLKFGNEKESLQQTLCQAESQLKSLHENDCKLKSHITKLNNENSALEKELQTLNQEIHNLNKAKTHVEKEILRYVDLESKLLEIERRTIETTAINEATLYQAQQEVSLLRDQNDELSSQLESMREKVKTLKAFHEKSRSSTNNKRRKGSNGNNSSGSKSLTLDGFGGAEDDCTDNEYPLEKKMGKFHLYLGGPGGDVAMFSDEVEELETSLASCGGSQPDSGNFPVLRAINLTACLGETSTDSPAQSILPPSDGYPTLQLEMGKVEDKNHNRPSWEHELNKTSIQETVLTSNTSTQTTEVHHYHDYIGDVEMEVNGGNSSIAELLCRITQLETDALTTEKERQELRDTCCDLESSLDLLREEYEKCEDYWHEKLAEAREIYEADKSAMDEQFQDLLIKIKEYEETFMNSSNQYPQRLPPIFESANLEQQVTELEEECEGLRRELRSLKVEQDSIISNYQRQWESRAMEECGRLELQVGILTKKCHEYETRLSSLAEEERSTLDSSGVLEMLRDRVRQLEFQLKHQEDQFRTQISQLEEEAKLKSREKQRRRTGSPAEIKKSDSSPQPPPPVISASQQRLAQVQVWNNNNSSDAVDLNGSSLLELLQHKRNQSQGEPTNGGDNLNPVVSPFLIWPQRYAHPYNNTSDKSASLPFIPVPSGGTGQYFPSFQQQSWNNPQNHTAFSDPWAPNQSENNNRKAWCHVELGWLQALRARLKQREDQCHILQRSLQMKEVETERVIAEMRYKHDCDAANWSQMMASSQEVLHQQSIKHKEQEEKLAHSELVMNDLWGENGKLRSALNATEQRVLQLENLLKYHISLQNQQSPTPHHNGHGQASPRSLPFHHQPNFT